jgi:sulfide dehydrogenase [flavocytochrome c] flavoprotein subunit
MTLDRRSFLKLVGAGAGAAGLPMVARSQELMPKGAKRVVVVGGGYGGSIAAKYIRMLDKSIEVVLIERNDHYVSCPFSNLYIGGIIKDLAPLTIKFDRLAANHGVKVVQAEVTSIDPAAKVVATSKGTVSYDRLVLSPGIDFRLGEIKGYDAAAMEVMPHAYKAGPQSVLLRKQLEAMKNGGTVVITMPLSPYRCPPGPYERASVIAHYLKKNKPKSKVVLIDANPDVTSKGALFKKGWKDHYEGILVYRPASKVIEVNASKKTVSIEGLEDVAGDVVNVIPPQRAGQVAVAAGLVGEDKNWCPVDATTFESTRHKNIHVIGDACIAGSMPKSGYSANSEAKICAMNVVALMNGKETVELSGINVCYSFMTDTDAVSVAGVYAVKDGKIIAVPNSGGVSPVDYSAAKTEALYAQSWLKNILSEMST